METHIKEKPVNGKYLNYETLGSILVSDAYPFIKEYIDNNSKSKDYPNRFEQIYKDIIEGVKIMPDLNESNSYDQYKKKIKGAL